MDIEIRALGWAVVLGILQMLLAATASTSQRGLKWNVSARDGRAPPLTGAAARLQRAWANFLETFPLFAAAVLAVVLLHRQNPSTALGAQLYLWARVLYVPLYAAGIPYLRSLVWGVAMAGIGMLVWPLLT
ncbi:hypothetical protein ARC78_14795 [Stenotrophomonas pictorum JCM 9942]|uniref:MAPEG family protein n=1 Tax=Stenotrophomonas pictorum JCM 9942 TaxID=1236960 RepID=A0A0R0A272_9GAMM|nr:MAPEG family protein [Stenotrophomonas pictorum]KRG39339.1 hypothetical protein ARC78_14795 [Stenotrophomonas pictorum JCM 9942]